MNLSSFYLVGLTIFLISCQSDSDKTNKIDYQYTPDPRAIELNEEATDIITKTLFTDSLNTDLLNEGLKKLDTAIKIDSQYRYSYLNKATIFKTLSHYDYALNEYKNATKFDSTNPELYFSIGLCYEKLEELSLAQDSYYTAINKYDQLIKKNPDNIDFQTGKAFLYLFTHDKEEALAQVDVIKADSDQEKEKVVLMINLINDFDKEDFLRDY